MTDDFESKLRRLKPFRGDGRRQTADGRRFRRIAYALVAVAATVLVIVCLIPQQEKLQNAKTTVIPAKAGIQTLDVVSPKMRQQLAQLLDEMSVANPIAEEKPVYPVVEIAVRETEVRRQELGVRRWERVHLDLLLPGI
jgi:hypothetical protein